MLPAESTCCSKQRQLCVTVKKPFEFKRKSYGKPSLKYNRPPEYPPETRQRIFTRRHDDNQPRKTPQIFPSPRGASRVLQFRTTRLRDNFGYSLTFCHVADTLLLAR